ncbi:metallophosphoesterase family protein [Halorussus halophilus]|uniref:metallophosphoesterase family protein n=1 Tax=Halorussus halophilus TaxID=2650975 RepID=UPI001300D8A9|nr:metallophosphoesterase [Halorussus halophilus]
MTKLSRRQLLAAVGGLSAAFTTSLDSPEDEETGVQEAFLDQLYRRPTAKELPVPDVRPAIGVTDHGLYEFTEGADGWQPVPLGTEDAPVPRANIGSLGVEEISVEPVKIGLLADPHYPGDARGLGATGVEKTTKKLKQFVRAMNDWEADRVFFMGDMMPTWGGRASSQRKIREFRHLVEDDLEMPVHPVWGNHEYQHADSWGPDWSYAPWGVSTHADTWYSVDASVAKIVVLNNGYSESDHVHTEFLPEQIEWLRNELNRTKRPVVVVSHLPLSVGTGQNYDYAVREEEVGTLLSRYDNVVCCLFGHCHHDSSSPPEETNQPAFFDQMREQRRYGMRHFFVPWIHRLQWDQSVTPFGKLFLYPGGEARLEASYEETGTRESFVVNAGASPPHYPEDAYLRPVRKRLRWQSHFDSIAGFGTEQKGSGNVTLHERGVELTTGKAGGRAVLRKRRGFAGSPPVSDGWTNCVWRCHAKLNSVRGATVDLLWGDPESNYVGYRIEDGEVRGVRADGSAEQETHRIESIENDTARLFQLFYSMELDRVNFVLGARGQRPKAGLTPGNPNRDGSDSVFFARLNSDSSGSLDVGWVAVHKHPDLAIRQ